MFLYFTRAKSLFLCVLFCLRRKVQCAVRQGRKLGLQTRVCDDSSRMLANCLESAHAQTWAWEHFYLHYCTELSRVYFGTRRENRKTWTNLAFCQRRKKKLAWLMPISWLLSLLNISLLGLLLFFWTFFSRAVPWWFILLLFYGVAQELCPVFTSNKQVVCSFRRSMSIFITVASVCKELLGVQPSSVDWPQKAMQRMETLEAVEMQKWLDVTVASNMLHQSAWFELEFRW